MKKKIWIILIVAVLVGAVVLGVSRSRGQIDVATLGDEKVLEIGTAQSPGAQKDLLAGKILVEQTEGDVLTETKNRVHQRLNGLRQARLNSDFNWDEEEAKDSECLRLQEFLEEKEEESAMAQARFLASSDSKVRRYSVIDDLSWLGTPAAMDILSELQNDEEEDIAEESFAALELFFDRMISEILTDPATGELSFDRDINEVFETCSKAILEASDDDHSDILITKVEALDEKLAIPILLEVLEKGTKGKKEIALRALDVVTHGSGVTNREEAMLWLLEDQEISLPL